MCDIFYLLACYNAQSNRKLADACILVIVTEAVVYCIQEWHKVCVAFALKMDNELL